MGVKEHVADAKPLGIRTLPYIGPEIPCFRINRKWLSITHEKDGGDQGKYKHVCCKEAIQGTLTNRWTATKKRNDKWPNNGEAVWNAGHDTDSPVTYLIERQRIASNSERHGTDG